MKLLKQLIIAATATFASILPVQASNNSIIELTFTNSEIQCGGTSLEILANVYHNGTLVKEGLSVGSSIFVRSLDGLSMTYEAANIDETPCSSLASPTELHLTQDDPIPDLPGAYDQASIATLVSQLAEYEDLYLVELGTTNSSSWAYDLQDAVFIVNTNPQVFTD